MSRYGHRFTTRGYDCPDCEGSDENPFRFAELQRNFGKNGFCLGEFSLICELCGGRGGLSGADFKAIYGILPHKAGVSARIVSR